MPKISQESVDAFNADMKPILAKYNFTLASEPYIEDGKIRSRAIIVPLSPPKEKVEEEPSSPPKDAKEKN